MVERRTFMRGRLTVLLFMKERRLNYRYMHGDLNHRVVIQVACDVRYLPLADMPSCAAHVSLCGLKWTSRSEHAHSQE